MNTEQIVTIIFHYGVPFLLGLFIFMKIVMPILGILGQIVGMLLTIVLELLRRIAMLIQVPRDHEQYIGEIANEEPA